MGLNAIEVEALSKRYFLGQDHGRGNLRETLSGAVRRIGRSRTPRSEIWSLRDVNLEVPEGTALGVIGRNGAGKSTLLKVLTRITEPTSGVSRTRGRVGSLLEVGTGFHPELTGRENVFLNGAILGMRRAEIQRRFDEIVEFAELTRFVDQKLKNFSSGMQARLAYSIAIQVDFDILLLDEVLAVGDQRFQDKCFATFGGFRKAGKTVIFVSHDLDSVRRFCDRALLLQAGHPEALGPTSDVIASYDRAQRIPAALADAG